MSASTRSTSPFIVFCKENRDAVKAANPTASFGDTAKLLSNIWKDMKRSEQEAYSESRNVNLGESRTQVNVPTSDQPLRRSSRLRNKRLGLDFWGLKLKK